MQSAVSSRTMRIGETGACCRLTRDRTVPGRTEELVHLMTVSRCRAGWPASPDALLRRLCRHGIAGVGSCTPSDVASLGAAMRTPPCLLVGRPQARPCRLGWPDLAEGAASPRSLVRNGGRQAFSAAGRARLCIARQKSRRPPSSAALRACGLRRDRPPAPRSPSRPRWARPENGRGEHHGDHRHLHQVRGRLHRRGPDPDPQRQGDQSARPRARTTRPPTSASSPARTEFGAAWKKTARETPAATTSPSSSTIRASRPRSTPAWSRAEDGSGLTLIWSRRNGD